MLHSLSIRDVVLVDRLDLEFSASLSALTGETGAGKSILLDALGLALGSRGDSGLVRAGAAQASVSAGFEIAARHPARALLDEQGLAAENPLVLRRVLGADGRSRAFVNDQPVSVGLLRRLGETLVEIHGQFENQGLLDPATHRAALDEYAGLADTAAEVAARHAAWRDCRTAEERAEDEARAARNDEDFLRHALAELDGLAPKPGEETELAQRRAMLGAREKLVEALNAALGELGHGKGPAGALRAAERLLARMAPQALGKLDPAIAALDRAASAVADAVAEVEALGHTLDLDASGLEAAEERLFALRALARKHRVEVDGLLALRGDIAHRLAAIDDRSGVLKRLAAETARTRAAYAEAAETLSAKRAAAAGRLDKAVAKELPPLKLDKARIRTRLDRLAEGEWGPGGAERVVFEVATNPGTEPGPLNKIASGGELARFMLALKVVLARAGARTGAQPTLIFDEVDSGIGGAAAAAVGERLAKLAADVQVLAVTHSPQVAARAGQHWRVVKKAAGRAVVTVVESLDARARREEIARMLSGATVTDAARVAADSLLAGAGA